MINKEDLEWHQERCNITREKLKSINDDGPWMDEPDIVEFKSHGFYCVLLRIPDLFHWCGYVGIPKTHPLYGKDYSEIKETADIEVHGGITYGGTDIFDEDDDLYWIGFDCAHFMDVIPALRIYLDNKNKIPLGCLEPAYRDLEFVKNQTCNLAKQLEEYEKTNHEL